jgi:hypothetical protein
LRASAGREGMDMEPTVFIAAKAVVTSDPTGYVMMVDTKDGTRAAVMFTRELMRRTVISILRRTFFGAAQEKPQPAEPNPKPVPCTSIRLEGTDEGTWILHARIGDMDLPLVVEAPAMMALAPAVARIIAVLPKPPAQEPSSPAQPPK